MNRSHSVILSAANDLGVREMPGDLEIRRCAQDDIGRSLPLKWAFALLILLCCCMPAVGQVRLQGAGATFPAPIYQRWVVEFERLNPGVRIDYQSIGSGGGVRGVIERTVDFGASDAPLSAAELARMPSEVVQIPTVAGAVVPAYSLPGVERLNLTGQIIADIYRGEITRWNHPAIREINPEADLPDLIITPIWRTDGSGTTYVFTSYLASQSEEFLWRVGYGKAVRWPVGRGGKGNEGVTAMVQRIRGAIGYVELNYASQLGLTHAHVRNREGRFVQASPETVSAAGAGAVDQMEETLAVNIWDQPGEASYPISAFTYIIVYQDLARVGNREEAQALVDFLYWATHEGQASAAAMDYAPLAGPVQARVAEVLAGLKWRGERLAGPGRGGIGAGARRFSVAGASRPCWEISDDERLCDCGLSATGCGQHGRGARATGDGISDRRAEVLRCARDDIAALF